MVPIMNNNGVIVHEIPELSMEKYSKKLQCPTCKSSLTVFDSAWKMMNLIDVYGHETSKVGLICPVCNNFFDTNGKLHDTKLLGTKKYC